MTQEELHGMKYGDQAISHAGVKATMVAQSQKEILVQIEGREGFVGYRPEDFLFLFQSPTTPEPVKTYTFMEALEEPGTYQRDGDQMQLIVAEGLFRFEIFDAAQQIIDVQRVKSYTYRKVSE